MHIASSATSPLLLHFPFVQHFFSRFIVAHSKSLFGYFEPCSTLHNSLLDRVLNTLTGTETKTYLRCHGWDPPYPLLAITHSITHSMMLLLHNVEVGVLVVVVVKEGTITLSCLLSEASWDRETRLVRPHKHPKNVNFHLNTCWFELLLMESLISTNLG